VDLINDVKAEKAKGASDAQLASALDAQRHGQFMIDFAMSENSMGFHAPEESVRILGDAINLCRIGQLSLHGALPPTGS
jgi:nitrite reductase (cytochrome c-552)